MYTVDGFSIFPQPTVASGPPVSPPLIDEPKAWRQYVPDVLFNPVALPAGPSYPFGFSPPLVDEPKAARQYIPDILVNPVALAAGTSYPFGFRPPLIDEPKAARQYVPDILINPVAPSGGSSFPFKPPLIDEPKAGRQFIPDVLFNPVALNAGPPRPFVLPLLDEPKASRQYIPDVLPNPARAIAAGPTNPFSAPLIDVPSIRRQYVTDAIFNAVLPAAGRSYPFSLPLLDKPKPTRQYIPDVQFNPSVLGAPLTVKFSSSAGRLAFQNATVLSITAPSFNSSISRLHQTGTTFRVSITGYRSSFGRLAFTNTFPFEYPPSNAPVSLSAASFFHGYASPFTSPIVPSVGYLLTGEPAVWLNGPVTSTWQWNRASTPISGATSLYYTPVSADVGEAISLTEIATNSGGIVSSTSAPTSAVIFNSAFLPVNVAAPTIAGTAQAGQVLTANAGLWTNSPHFAYQWKQNGVPIAGQTGTTYIPVTADIGHTISVTVTATNISGSISATSASTASVIGPLPVNTALPTITGSPVVGNVLAGHAGTWLYSPTLSYQWDRGGTPISGATSINYTAVTADIGLALTLVETGTSTSGGGSASATSVPTAAVVSSGSGGMFNSAASSALIAAVG